MPLQGVEKIVLETSERSQQSQTVTAESQYNLTLVEASVERSREQLKLAQRYLETEGSQALQRAIERSQIFGMQSEQMSQVVHVVARFP